MGDKTESRCYSRNDMIRMRDLPKSRTRPSDLSEEFNNEDGLFSPDKWLQHRWQCEGVESRPVGGGGITRKKASTRAEEVAGQDLEAIVLSPQRRGFFSGCRAPSPKIPDDDKTAKSSRWRLNNGVDFKPPFQKSMESNRSRSGNNSSVWRNNVNDRSWNDKSGRHNRGNSNVDEKPERIPEWVDEGPSSMTDVIELKGFDDDVREKKPKRRRNRDSASKSGSHSNTGGTANSSHASASDNSRQRNSHSNSTQGSRPSSRLAAAAASLPPIGGFCESNKESGDVGTVSDKPENSRSGSVLESIFAAGGKLGPKPMMEDENSNAVNAAAAGIGAISLPNSDAEFAAFLGILDVDPASIQKDPIAMQANQPSCSRLSRFFCKNQSTDQRPLFDNFNAAPQCPSPRPPSGNSHSGPSVLELASTGGVFNRNSNATGGDSVPYALKELFSNAPPRPHTPTTPRDFKGGMTVEELERDLKMHPYEQRPILPMQFPPHNAPFNSNGPHPNANLLAAKLAAIQTMGPSNEQQFLTAFHYHMQQHIQRMSANAAESRMENVNVPPPTKFPFDSHQQQQQPHHYDARSPFMPTSVLRHLSVPPVGTVNRPLFDNFNAAPQCPSPRPQSGNSHSGPSVLELASTGGVFNRNSNATGGDSVPYALKELFSNALPRPHTPTTPRDFKGGMTVEELERDLKMHPFEKRPILPMQFPPHNAPFNSANGPNPNANMLAAKLAMGSPNEQQFHYHMQQHIQRMSANAAEGGMENVNMPSPSKFPFDFHQQQQQPHHYDARSPFMPTSVLRQLSVPPGGSVNNPALASDQQQLNMAIMRGDLASAQNIRARMIAGFNSYQE